MFSNTTRVEIQFGDCDPAGIVYYPNYFRFFDNATAAMLTAAFGRNKRSWLAHYGIAGIPMVDTGARFLKPSRFGDQRHSRFDSVGSGRDHSPATKPNKRRRNERGVHGFGQRDSPIRLPMAV